MNKAKKFFAVLIVLLCTLSAGCSVGNGYKTISANDAMKIMQTAGDYIILDVRTQAEFDKKHIPGALLLPIADIREGKFDKIPDKNQMLLLYCWTGRRAEDSAKILAENGYTNVYTFGGLVDWDGALVGADIDDNN